MPNNCKSLLKIDRQCNNVSCQIWSISFEDGAPFSCNILREMSLYKKNIMKINCDSHKSFTWIENTFSPKRLVDRLGIDSCSLVLFSTLYSEVFCTASVLLIFVVGGLLKIIESRPKLWQADTRITRHEIYFSRKRHCI